MDLVRIGDTFAAGKIENPHVIGLLRKVVNSLGLDLFVGAGNQSYMICYAEHIVTSDSDSGSEESDPEGDMARYDADHQARHVARGVTSEDDDEDDDEANGGVAACTSVAPALIQNQGVSTHHSVSAHRGRLA